MRLIECYCGPCSGRRVLSQGCKEGVPFVGIQILLDGGERFRIGNKTVSVTSNSMVFWNSFESTDFEVRTDLHKVTLLMPQSVLESRLQIGSLIRGGVVDTSEGIGALLFAYIRELASQFDSVYADDGFGPKWACIELGATAALGLQQPFVRSPKSHLHRIQTYVLQRIQDPELSVTRIANENGISVRYLHSLFAAHGCSISKWILECRLERCRDALTARKNGRCVVKDVALQWGFTDTAHFSRVFKRHFGMTPYECWSSAHLDHAHDEDTESVGTE